MKKFILLFLIFSIPVYSQIPLVNSGDVLNAEQFNLVITKINAQDTVLPLSYTSSDFSALLASNGYQKLPSGIILQWGIAAQNASYVNFPIPFPNAVFNIEFSFKDVAFNNSFGPNWLSTNNWSATGFSLQFPATTIGGSRPWFAVGY